MSEAIRRFREEDRGAVSALLGDERAIDSPDHRLHVAEESGRVIGLALGRAPDSGTEAQLGSIVLEEPTRWDLFHRLLRALVEHAVGLGFTAGGAETGSRRMVRHLRQTFGLEPAVSARHPVSGVAMEWSYRVDLRAFLEQLERVS